MKKNVMHISMTGLLLVLLLPLQVLAEGSGDGFRLDQSGTVTLDSSHAAKEGISSCCFSLTVEPENGNHVEFVFAGDLAEIMEYRYNADEKKLNVYVAGKDSLFPEGTESLAIGKVVVTDGSGNSGTATVSVDEGSLQFVYGAEARIMEDVAIPEAVKLGQSGGSDLLIPPPGSLVTPPPVETSEPEAPPAPSESAGGAADGNQSNGTQAPGGSSPVRKPGGTKPGGTQVGSTQGTGNGQGSNNQESSESQESSSAPEPEPEVESSPEPTEEASSEPIESSEEEMSSASAESPEGEGNLSKGEGGFWKELKPVLTGLGIGALLLGIGAVVVMLLIKAPKDKQN